jgi:hypothetical protein
VGEETLVDDPNDLALNHVCSPANLCSRLGDFTLHIHPVLMLLFDALSHLFIPNLI